MKRTYADACMCACLHRECSSRVRKEKTKKVFDGVDENRGDGGVLRGAQRHGDVISISLEQGRKRTIRLDTYLSF